jgi:hypothetical protein
MPEWFSQLIGHRPARQRTADMALGCPWCHVTASDALLRQAKGLPAHARLTCPSCSKASPVSYWHLEGEIDGLASVSGGTVVQIDAFSREKRDRIEARLRQSHDEIERTLTGRHTSD